MGGERPASWRIGDWEFRPDTGELREVASTGEQREARLQPQPSRLLELLAARNGELVTREEIRDLLWPDTHVDLDQSLSFCVRQIRGALGDSASDPSYVETLPRRGYRLLRPAFAANAPPTAERKPEPGQPSSTRLPRGGRLWVGAAALPVVLLTLWWLGREGRPTPRPTRLGIMPFELATSDGTSELELARVSESLVVDLARTAGVEIIGPRTTAVYSAFPFPDLRRLAVDLEIDYVLNARVLSAGPEPELIVELIRLPDGAHRWVARYAPPWSSESVAGSVRSGVVAALAREQR